MVMSKQAADYGCLFMEGCELEEGWCCVGGKHRCESFQPPFSDTLVASVHRIRPCGAQQRPPCCSLALR